MITNTNKLTLAQKIIASHIQSALPAPGEEIALKIDQTLTQDATGTMAYLEFESMGIDRVRTEKSVAYIDHNTLQSGFENADDHRFIASIAKKHGIYFSRPGNGICHQVHLERFGVPGKTLIGSDSHTPTCGGLGMLAIGAGGLDVAVAMGGGRYYIPMPKMYKVNLSGRLSPFVSAKDVALEILRILSVSGGVGAVIEWGGEGALTLSVPERATITNMGAELGATTSIFPSDDVTKSFLESQGRAEDYIPLASDEGAVYDKVINIDLSALSPMVAKPHSPDNVVSISTLIGKSVDQVCIGSCTNSSLSDMLKVAKILKGRTVAHNVDLSISPGSRQVLSSMADCGALSDILASGARLLECACGPCIGMGFSPPSKGVSLRTFNRNFEGRSGTQDAGVYLVSPEVAAACAIKGEIFDPRQLGIVDISVSLPDKFKIDDSGIIPPATVEEAKFLSISRGPNIKEFPISDPVEDNIDAGVSLVVGDNITTDHIMPAGAKILPYRSNIPHLSQYCFSVCDDSFAKRAKEMGKSIVIGGENYGQGSSREHAALVPLYLGVRAVIAKSFARIHAQNLVNAGIVPLVFKNSEDYNKISLGDSVILSELFSPSPFAMIGNVKILLCPLYTGRQSEILRAGGLLPFTR